MGNIEELRSHVFTQRVQPAVTLSAKAEFSYATRQGAPPNSAANTETTFSVVSLLQRVDLKIVLVLGSL
jgi:hypothetical protein